MDDVPFDAESMGLVRVEVQTLAKPDPFSLMAVRHELQRHPGIFAKFREAKEESWSTEKLVEEVVPELHKIVKGTEAQIVEAVKYLADEYVQTDGANLLIDEETGEAIAILREEDYYEPPPVVRESGNIVHRGKQIRPGILANLFRWKHESKREKQIHAELEKRAKEAGLLRPNLEIATRKGRKSVVEDVRESLPTVFPRRLSGSARVFVQRFDVEETDRETLNWYVAEAVVKTPIADPLAANLHFAYAPRVLAIIGQQWARQMAWKVAEQASKAEGIEKRSFPATELTASRLVSSSVWIAPSTEAVTLGECALDVLAINEGVPCVGLSGKVGTIYVNPHVYEVESLEISDRWEIHARIQYAVEIHNQENIEVLDLTDIPASGVSVV